MGDSKDAFGVYHHLREGGGGSGSVAVGQESEVAENSAAFWKGDFYVSIIAMDAKPESRAAVLKLAQSVAAAIPKELPPPDLIDRIPQKDLLKKQVFYFHNNLCLNDHYVVAEDNVLDLGDDTEGVVAKYALSREAQKDTPAVLVIVRYPTVARAQHAHETFAKARLHDADAVGKAKTQDGKWVAARLVKNELICVLDAPSSAPADTLIDATCSDKPVQPGKR